MNKEIAVVTGANGRVGQETAKRLTAMGYHVVGLDIAPESVAGVDYRQCDITDLDQVNAVAAEISESLGLIRVLVNNAGVWHGKTFFEITPRDYDLTYGVNIRGAFFLTQEVSRRLIDAAQGGAIVSVASVVGVIGSGVTDYGGSKAAVINLTKSLSKALGPHGIRVNAVSPGAINTAMGEKVPAEVRDKLIATTGLRRAAEPEEIAAAIAYLVGPDASYVNGAVIDVNGGL
ncbi:SDR family NAD(P)-dependent oxidoreductase [Paracoccus sp. J55]|uniref:SDR family NAD(P)-dependent oxidoreductase n=1 Tax=Paracoccus sp. J55 TaxID=935849 RepID=UPI000491654A|nr:SDR family oxidoreductase [Paracoccus sp. J55]